MPPFRTSSSDAAMPPWPPLASCRSRDRLSWWSSRRFWHHSCCCRCYGAPRKVRDTSGFPQVIFLQSIFRNMPADAIVLLPGLSQLMDGLCRSGLAYVRIIINEKKMRSLFELFVILSVRVWCPEARFWSRKVGRRGKTNRNQRKTKCVR